MRAVILQSNYIPWKGYFDLISNADVCIFLDSVQFTKNDWRNRNIILNGKGENVWLTIPVGQSISRKITDVELPTNDWGKRHLSLFKSNYGHAPYFDSAYQILSDEVNSTHTFLSSFNQSLIKRLMKDFFNPSVDFINDFELLEGVETMERNQRIINLLNAVGANEYISGPSASSYIDTEAFDSSRIKILYAEYGGYPEYPQVGESFRNDVSVLDLISWNGTRSIEYLKRKDLLHL